MGDFEALGEVFLIIFVFILVYALVNLTIAILLLIAKWKLLDKAGESGWKSLIPFYNTWVMCKIIGISPYWVIEISVVALLFIAMSFLCSGIVYIFYLLIMANTWYFKIIYYVSLSKSYGHDLGFGICSAFFSVITLPILAFGKSKYIGPQPISDPVMKFILDTLNIKDNGTGKNDQQSMNNNVNNTNMNNNNMNMSNNMNQTTLLKYCPNCGSQVQDGDNFCLGCGAKLN